MIENEEQAMMRRGRQLAEMNPDDRLAYANAASPVSAPSAETAEPPIEDDMTPAAREWLGDWKVENLSPEMRAQFDWLNTNTVFRRDEAAPNPRRDMTAPEDRPDMDKLGAVSPERRSGYADAVSTMKAARAEAHLPPVSRRISQDRLNAARELVEAFARPV